MNVKDLAFRWYFELLAVEKLAQCGKTKAAAERFAKLKAALKSVALT